MRPALVWALVASLAAAAGLALWPTDDDSEGAGHRAGRAATVPVAAPAAPLAASSVAPPAASPAAPLATSSSGATPAAQTTATTTAPPMLPTRAADWPAPHREALAAWQGPPPPPPPVAAARLAAGPALPARPAVPEFPYRWIGQLDDGGAPQLLLASAQRSVGVRLGDMLDKRWRLERDASGALQAVYLATGDKVAVRGAPVDDKP